MHSRSTTANTSYIISYSVLRGRCLLCTLNYTYLLNVRTL